MSIRREAKTFFSSFFRLIWLILKALWRLVKQLANSKREPPKSPQTESFPFNAHKLRLFALPFLVALFLLGWILYVEN